MITWKVYFKTVVAFTFAFIIITENESKLKELARIFYEPLNKKVSFAEGCHYNLFDFPSTALVMTF